MLADAPTSGGYPKPGVVVEEDLAKLAQLAPGSGRVRFVPLELN
jgi:allophanate hydrolase subunit 2